MSQSNVKLMLAMVLLLSGGCQPNDKEKQKVNKRGSQSQGKLSGEGGIGDQGVSSKGKMRRTCLSLDLDGCLNLVKVNETFAKLDENIAHLTTSNFQVYQPGTSHQRKVENQANKKGQNPNIHMLGKALEINDGLLPLMETGVTWKSLKSKFGFLRPAAQVGCKTVSFQDENGALVSYSVLSGSQSEGGIGELAADDRDENRSSRLDERRAKAKQKAQARFAQRKNKSSQAPLVLKNEKTNEIRIYQAVGCGFDASLKIQIIQPLKAPVCGKANRELGVTYNVLIGDKAGSRSAIPINYNLIQLIRDHSDSSHTFKRLTSSAGEKKNKKVRNRLEPSLANRTVQVEISLAQEALAHLNPGVKLKDLTCPGENE